MGDTLHIEPGQAMRKRTPLPTTLILFSVLVAMVAVFSALSRDFYSFQNISTMLTNISFSGIVAGTLTLVMITGGLDISVGGNIALTSCLVAFLYNLNPPVPAWALVPIALGLGAAIGSFNGFFITRLDLNPIITTLGTMAVTRGLGYVLTKSRSILIMENVTGFIGRTADSRHPDPDSPRVLRGDFRRTVLRAEPVQVRPKGLLHRRECGRGEGVRHQGEPGQVRPLPDERNRGLPERTDPHRPDRRRHAPARQRHGARRDHRGTPGGTALAGGKGSILGTLAGVLILGVLYNGFTMIGFRYVHIRVFQGVLLILIVALYELRQKKRY